MPRPDQTIGQSASASLLEVRYLDPHGGRIECTDAANILGAVGFGVQRPDFLPLSCPFISAPLKSAMGSTNLEIWRTSSPCRAINFGPVTGACGDHLAFGAIPLPETRTTSLEEIVEAAYLAIFDFLDASGFTAPLRFWNYLTKITQDDAGLERYRRFNVGRHRAFSKRLREALPPAASGVGGNHGVSAIYFLAAREPAHPVENPRQMSAFAYPPLYGPQSPSFSRASIFHHGGGDLMFISGTASIVGHESRHAGNLHSQMAETVENLLAVIGAAGIAGLEDWAFKIYLRDPAYLDAVDLALTASFGPAARRLYLQGEICRAELVVEIEAFCHT